MLPSAAICALVWFFPQPCCRPAPESRVSGQGPFLPGGSWAIAAGSFALHPCFSPGTVTEDGDPCLQWPQVAGWGRQLGSGSHSIPVCVAILWSGGAQSDRRRWVGASGRRWCPWKMCLTPSLPPLLASSLHGPMSQPLCRPAASHHLAAAYLSVVFLPRCILRWPAASAQASVAPGVLG